VERRGLVEILHMWINGLAGLRGCSCRDCVGLRGRSLGDCGPGGAEEQSQGLEIPGSAEQQLHGPMGMEKSSTS
jgi:hypothetical protein